MPFVEENVSLYIYVQERRTAACLKGSKYRRTHHISSAVIIWGTVCNASTSGVVYITDKFARHVLCVAFLRFAVFFKNVQRGFAVQGQYLTLRHDHFHPHPFHLTIHHRPTVRCYIN